MRELFIYYRIPVAHAGAALDAVVAFQARLREQHPALTTRLLRRPDQSDPQTWMEIYAFDHRESAGAMTRALEAEIEASAATALAPHLLGARHVEVFVPCAS